MDKVQSYIQRNQKRFLDELLEWLTIPSISADSKYKGDVAKAAAFIADKLKTAGAENVEITPTAGHPVVYGEKILDPALPTVLVYGHYDVQPPDPLNLWESEPFVPVIKKT
ncbi:MAG TPA: peptidase dimerization domain protein, partial [Flavilitoribacter sp.]|nr:peptidase dimerization domain protein [Flavilitoribacter sp.]